MAQKNEKKKKGKGKKIAGAAIGGIVTAILAPILIIVLLVSFLFAILDAIVTLIKDLVVGIFKAVVKFLEDPIGSIKTAWGKFSNWWDKHVWGDNEFDPNEFEELRRDPVAIITQESFETIKESLEEAVNRNSAGLDNFMLKKMMLAYNRGLYLDDTNILIELTAEDFEGNSIPSIFENIIEAKPFSIKRGDSDEEFGEDGKIYMCTKGTVQIYTNTSNPILEQLDSSWNKSGNKLLYYDPQVLEDIYNNHYLYGLDKGDDDGKEYAESVLNYLKNCYTYTEDGIGMYSARDTITTEKKWAYEKEASRETDIWEWTESLSGDLSQNKIRSLKTITERPVELETIEFNSKISEYACPMEFMINLLEITGSRDFVNAFIETLGEETYIKLVICNIANEEISYEIEESKSITTVYGDNRNTGFSKSWKDEGIVREATITTKTVEQYDLAVEEIKTWYADIKSTNKTNYTVKTEKINTDGERENISETYEDITLSDEALDKVTQEEEYASLNNTSNNYTDEDIFKVKSNEYSSTAEYTMNDCLNILFNYAIKNGSDYTGYVFSNMDVEKTQRKKIGVYATKGMELTEGISSGVVNAQYNFNSFFGLLSNKYGAYKLGADYLPVSSGGKLVEYNDIYGGKTIAVNMLINGSDMLIQLLESSENTAGLAPIMQIALTKFSNDDYSITEWEDFGTFNEDEFVDVDESTDSSEDTSTTTE